MRSLSILLLAGAAFLPVSVVRADDADAASGASTEAAAPAVKEPGSRPEMVSADDFVMDFLEYRMNLQAKMAESWKHYLSLYEGPAEMGYVAFRYYINSRGEVCLIEQTSGKKDSPLAMIGMNAIVDINRDPLAVPSTVRSRCPQGFFNNIAFQVR